MLAHDRKDQTGFWFMKLEYKNRDESWAEDGAREEATMAEMQVAVGDWGVDVVVELCARSDDAAE